MFCDYGQLIDSEDKKLNCYGLIIFRINNESCKLETLLVTSKKGHLGFPKGKREYKKGESQLQTTFREVYEETHLEPSMMKYLVDDSYQPIWIVEDSLKGNPTVGLFIAMKDNTLAHTIAFPPNELLKVEWIGVDDVMEYPEKLMYTKRKIILKQATDMIKKYLIN
jgi:8-oxo-dGTP pyrophosphatase MutT (NUDIX family)